jgi:phosphoglycerate dehydrogenase-like enzyme
MAAMPPTTRRRRSWPRPARSSICAPVAAARTPRPHAARDADILMVRESPVTRRVLEGAPRCKAVIRYGIGVDNIDQAAARERQHHGLQRAGLRHRRSGHPDRGTGPGGGATATPARPRGARRTLVHGRAAPMHRLRGGTLGLVGYGRIARMTQAMFAGFGFARVHGARPAGNDAGRLWKPPIWTRSAARPT